MFPRFGMLTQLKTRIDHNRDCLLFARTSRFQRARPPLSFILLTPFPWHVFLCHDLLFGLNDSCRDRFFKHVFLSTVAGNAAKANKASANCKTLHTFHVASNFVYVVEWLAFNRLWSAINRFYLTRWSISLGAIKFTLCLK